MVEKVVEREYHFLSDDTVFKIFFKRDIVILRRLIAMSLQITEEDITDIKFIDPTIIKDYKKSKKSVLDLLVEINHSKKVNVEMQNSNNNNTTKRFTWHLCNKYTEDLKEGEDYSKLKEVYGIYLLNYNDENYPNFFSKYESYDRMNVRTTAESLINMSVFNLSKIRDIDKYNFSEEEKDLIRLIHCKDERELRNMAKKSYDLEEAIRILDEINADKELRDQIYYEQRRRHDEAQARSDRDEAIKEKDEAIKEKDNAIKERNEAIKSSKKEVKKAFAERDSAFAERDIAISNLNKFKKNLEYETKKLKKEKDNAVKKVIKEKENAINQNKIGIAKKMLNKNEDINYISEITGLSKKEIEKINK